MALHIIFYQLECKCLRVCPLSLTHSVLHIHPWLWHIHNVAILSEL